MDERQRGIIIGSMIILIGVLILLANLDVLNISGDISVGGIFLLIGITLFSFYFSDKQKYYFLILGGSFCTLGATIVVQALRMIPFYYRDNLSWVVFLAGVGLVFLSIYLTRKQLAWSLLPSGFFLTLSIMTLIKTYTWLQTAELWFILLIGWSLTLYIFYLLSQKLYHSGWAKIVSIVFAVLSVFVLYLSNRDSIVFRIIFPAALILAGGYFLYRSLKVED